MSEKFFERRPQPAQFPPKLGALPGIGGSVPSSPMQTNQLVPYSKSTEVDPEKYRQLESRINISERSNRALLEEVVRLQSELKSSIRRNEEIIRQEQLNRQQIENSLRASHEMITQLNARLKRTEEKLQDEKAALAALMNQQKNVEQAILGSQQQLLSRKDFESSKIDELRSELAEVARVKDNLERVTFQLADEMRQLKTKLDTQTVDLVSTVNELKHKAKRLEDDNRQLRLDSMRKQNELQNIGEQSTHQLRAQVESRLAELRDVVVDLRSKHELEVQDRRTLEQQIQMRLTELQNNIREQSRKSDEAINAMEALQKEREHNTETERIQLQSKIAEIAEEVSKKILKRELKLREDMRQKFSQLEQALVHEQMARQKYEKESREENAERWESLKKLTDDELQLIREQLKNEKKKSTETLHKLNEAVNLIEKQMEEHKKQQDKLLSAEIKARKQGEKETHRKIDKLEEQLRVATNTLQDAIGATASKVTDQGDKLKEELREEIEEVKKAETRHIADLDARILALSNKITKSEETLEAKIHTVVRRAQINEETSELNEGRKLQEQQIQDLLSDYHIWKDVTQRTIEELKKQTEKLPNDLYELEEKFKMHKSTTETQLNAETENRKVQIAELKEELEKRIPSTPPEPSNKDIEACQSSIRKLAESIQTVKTVLGMKIQSEQKLRETTIQNIQEELEEIQKKLKEGDANKKDDKKDEDDDKKDDDKDEGDDDDDKKKEDDDKDDDDKKG